jgi:hypothetical protein
MSKRAKTRSPRCSFSSRRRSRAETSYTDDTVNPVLTDFDAFICRRKALVSRGYWIMPGGVSLSDFDSFFDVVPR